MALRRDRLVPVLGIVLVLAVAASAFLFYRYARFDDAPAGFAADGPTVTDAERGAVLAVTEQFALRMDNIDGKDVKGYTEGVLELLTTKGKASFEKQFEALQKVGVDPKTKGEGRVLATAIAEMDDDSATTLVVHDAVVTTAQGSTGRHYRWTVSLRKVHGDWLVDDFNPVE
jgi:predicted RecA/RadA family phage recombinase